MRHYVVVTRGKPALPIDHFASLGGAADKIYRERKFTDWDVMAQEGSKIAPMRELTRFERIELQAKLFPSLDPRS